MQYFPKKQHFLPPDILTYVCVAGGKKCYFFGINFSLIFIKYINKQAFPKKTFFTP